MCVFIGYQEWENNNIMIEKGGGKGPSPTSQLEAEAEAETASGAVGVQYWKTLKGISLDDLTDR